MGEIPKADTAVILARRDPEQAKIAQRPPERHRKAVVPVDIGRLRRNTLAGKPPHAFAQSLDLFAQGKIQSASIHRASSLSDYAV
jgi:hypothetical protein